MPPCHYSPSSRRREVPRQTRNGRDQSQLESRRTISSSAASSGWRLGCVRRACAATARSTLVPPNQHTFELDVHLPSSCFACTIIADRRKVNAQTGHGGHKNGQFDRCGRRTLLSTNGQ